MKAQGCSGPNRGLTLIEVLVATVLLGAVLAPILGMFTTAAQGYTKGGQETMALNLARGRLEDCLTLGYSALASLPEADSPWQLCPDYAGFEYQVTAIDYDPLLKIKKLVVRVRPVTNPTGQVELVTLVARWP